MEPDSNFPSWSTIRCEYLFEARGGKTSALVECFITWQDGERKIRTRGIDANQVFAGIEATLRMLNLKLAPDPV